MGAITIYNGGGTVRYTIRSVLSSTLSQTLREDENTLNFEVRANTTPNIEPGDMLSYNGQNYDIIKAVKRAAWNEKVIQVEAEHVSYRLLGVEIEYGAETGTPTSLLDNLLAGTEFTRGIVQASGTHVFELDENTSAREAIVRLADILDLEVEFDNYTVNLVSHRGSSSTVYLAEKKNVMRINVTSDNQEETTTYSVTMARGTDLELGDEVSISYPSMNISATGRVISIEKDPFNTSTVSITIGDKEAGFTSSLINKLNEKVGLGTPYYGVTISKQDGIKIARSDGLSEAIFNSDLFTMRALVDGSMKDRLYFDPLRGDFVFDGLLDAEALVADALYAEQGDIAELTVDRLSTSRRIRKYILQDTSDDNFIKIQDQYIKWVTGTIVSSTGILTEDGLNLLTESGISLTEEIGSAATEQATNRFGRGLYWQREPVGHTTDGYPTDINGVQIYATTNPTNWPVAVYKYTELVKSQYAFEQQGQNYIPQVILGAGDENGNSKGYFFKDETSLKLRYVSSARKNVDITFSDEGFVDAMHRRLKSCYIDPTGAVEYTVEGSDALHLLSFNVDGDTVTYRWPDGFVCAITIPGDEEDE